VNGVRRPHDRRVSLRPHGTSGIFFHPDQLVRDEKFELSDVTEGTVIGADQKDRDAELFLSAARPGNDLARSFVPPEGVDRDRKDQSTSIAWRPLYHPQFGQTTCGSFAWWQFGQRLCAGSERVQFAARLLRLLDFEVFFLGTGICSSYVVVRGPSAPFFCT